MGMGKVSMNRLRRKNRTPGVTLLIVFIIISFALMTLSVKEAPSGPIHTVRAIIGQVQLPFLRVGGVLTVPIKGIGQISHNLTADQETLSELEAENQRLLSDNAKLQEYRAENERLTGLLNIRDVYQLTGVAARITGADSDPWNRTLTINRGSSSEIEINMPVLDSAGLLGQVIEVGPTVAKVRLIDDEHSGVSSMVQRGRISGVVRGSVDGTLTLDFIPIDADVAVGDVIITSGLGGVYPKGILIGTVSSVTKTPGSLYAEVIVAPPARGGVSEEVLVITTLNAPENQLEYPLPQASSDATTQTIEATQAEGSE